MTFGAMPKVMTKEEKIPLPKIYTIIHDITIKTQQPILYIFFQKRLDFCV
jgi:hypothetical protein